MAIFYDIEHAPRNARIIVCGGRTYGWPHKLYDSASARNGDVLRIGIERELYPAFWGEEGRAAGPKRNRRMHAGFEPEGVVAFPGNDGTADMVRVVVEGGDAWIVKVDW